MVRVPVLFAVVATAFLAAGCGLFKPKEFKEFSDAQGGFRVLMPGTPTPKTESAAGIKLMTWSIEETNGAYMVAYADMPIPANEPEAQLQNRLDGARNQAIANIQGTLKQEARVTMGGRWPGRDITASFMNGKGLMRARVYIVQTRLYQVVVVGTPSWAGSANATKFLDSLALTR
jgi:hypothetical protein